MGLKRLSERPFVIRPAASRRSAGSRVIDRYTEPWHHWRDVDSAADGRAVVRDAVKRRSTGDGDIGRRPLWRRPGRGENGPHPWDCCGMYRVWDRDRDAGLLCI